MPLELLRTQTVPQICHCIEERQSACDPHGLSLKYSAERQFLGNRQKSADRLADVTLSANVAADPDEVADNHIISLNIAVKPPAGSVVRSAAVRGRDICSPRHVP